MSRLHPFTSESVAEGHPDKLADQISDTIVDAFLARDPYAHVACETLVANGLVVLAGEFKTADPAVFREVRAAAEGLVRTLLHEVGYRDAASGIDPAGCEVRIAFNHQSPDIDQGVERGGGLLGAGDQGMMFGFACDETPALFPLAQDLANRLVRRQAEVRRSGRLPWLRPDAKSQVTVLHDGVRVVAIDKVVLSTQHAPGVAQEAIRAGVLREIVDPLVPESLRSTGFRVLVNPTGAFETGGPRGDTGVTGRKIIVDTYGGACPHGGGAFSGKDPTKVDRSAAYMARHVAKHVVAAGLARRCTLQVSYAIGVAEPMSVFLDLHGTGTVDEARVETAVTRVFDFTPAGILRELDLRRPIYRRTAAYGHFGRDDPAFTWEHTPRVDALRAAVAAE